MSWTLNSQTLADLRVDSARLSVHSQAADVLAMSFARPCDTPPIPAGTWCELAWEGTTIFAGEAILPGGTGEGARDRSDLIISGPWADLARLIYRDGAGSSTSVRLRFPADPASTEAVMLQECVADVLAHAIGRGARLSLGVIDLDGEIPSQEFDGLPYAQILVNLLRFSPGAAVWFDYSTVGTPSINVERASGLPALSISGPGSKGLRVDQRTDFQVTGTQLVYRKKIVSNYGEAEGVAMDNAGSVNALGALIMPLDLGPASVQYELLVNRLALAQALPSNEDWWQQFLPDQTVLAALSMGSTGDTALTHYIAAGALPSWMLSHVDGVPNADPNGCTGPLPTSPAAAPVADAAFEESPPALHIANEAAFKIGRRKFTAALLVNSEEEGDTVKTYTLDLPCTDCSSDGVYYRESVSSWDPGEPVPDGLAAAFQASCARLAYSGQCTVKQNECSPETHRPGLALNITGTDAPAWSTMLAPVQNVEHDLMLGESTLSFGPASRLGPADLLELARAARARKMPARAEAEEDAEPEPVSYSATAASASEAPPASSEEADTGSVNVRVFGLPTELESEAAWTVGDRAGTGDGDVELPAGEYTAVFQFVVDAAAGKLYVAPPTSVEVTEGGSVNADADYEEIAQGTLNHPFKATLETVGTEESPIYELTVGQGNLYEGLGNWGTQEITGLGTPLSVVENDYVWLKGTYAEGELDSVDVEAGAALPVRIGISTGETPEQTSWTTRICRIVSDGAGGLKVEQNLFQHLTLIGTCNESVACQYPLPIS